jgi:hypothetical protein
MSPLPAVAANTVAGPRIVGFTTNHANHLKVEVDSPVPASLQYLLSDNPRFRYYLNGASIKPPRDRLPVTIDLPPGRNVVEIRYRHWLLRLFWVGYALYGLLLAGVLLAPLARAWRGRRARRD